MPDTNSTPPKIVMISVNDLVANSWNPNYQTPEQFAENCAEMRRLGQPHNPITVRPLENAYEIINGEHTWRAAKEIGLAEVPCEIVEIGDFEARLQTLKRNQHGTHDPVRLGQMYQEMLNLLSDQNRSIRGLARHVDIAEATLRYYLDYAKAAELRSGCAPGEIAPAISELSHAQVRTYLKLPDAWRDLWLDGGADMELLTDLSPEPANVAAGIARCGLEQVIDAGAFRSSLRFAWALAVKRTGHHRVTDIDDYLGALARVRLRKYRAFPPPEVMDLLPCRVCEEAVEVLISVEQWAGVIEQAAARTATPKRFHALVEDGVMKYLREINADPGEVYGPEISEALDRLDAAPACVQAADFLTLGERLQLAQAQAEAPADIVLRAHELAIERLRAAHSADENGAPRARHERAAPSVVAVFEECVRQLLEEQRAAAEDEFFGDRDDLMQAVLAKVTADKEITEAFVGRRPAAEVLAERLRLLAPPEFMLLAAGLLRSSAPGRHWLKAAGGCVATPKKSAKQKAAPRHAR